MEENRKLYQCDTFDDQVTWCRSALEAGKTLTDPGVWVAGADPDKIIRHLRRKGMPIDTLRVKVKDAAGETHAVPAWRIRRS